MGSDDWTLTEIHPYIYIPAGGTGYYYFSYFMPGLPSGTYDLIAKIDSDNDLLELNDGNNLVLLADRLKA